MKVLIVDDSAIMRRLILQILEILDHEGLEAASGEEGLELLGGCPDVSLVLLDWNMPGMNGIEFLRSIKADPAHADIPVIMLTTESGRRKMIEAIEAGARHYLVKPFQPDVLATKIVQCVGDG